MWQNSLTTRRGGAYHGWGAESGWGMGEVGRAGRGEGGGTGIGMCKIIKIIKILLWDILCQTPDGSGHYQHHRLPHSYWYGPYLKHVLKASGCFRNPKYQSPHSSKQKHDQAHHSNIPVPGTNVCLRVSIAVKRHRDHSKSYKGKLFIGVACSSEVQSFYHHGGERGSVQADMVLAASWLGGNRK